MTLGKAVRRYGAWLRRRMLGRPARPVREIPTAVCPRSLQPGLPTFGFDVEALRDRFAAIAIDGSAPGQLSGYARQDLERFLRTAALVPDEAGTALEIGANPYFTTLLLTWLRPDLRLELTNFFGDGAPAGGIQTVAVDGPDGPERRSFRFDNVNVEAERLPHDDAMFDVVLYCEVLEHMTDDPVATLLEIARVLRPGGRLVLTTPNAARIENVTRLIAGLPVADQYSGFGPYGRHNREYTVEEVEALLAHCGFAKEIAYTADVHANHAALHLADPRQLEALCGHRAGTLGQYIFSRWRKASPPCAGRPAWLYRSRPADDLSTACALQEPAHARF